MRLRPHLTPLLLAFITLLTPIACSSEQAPIMADAALVSTPNSPPSSNAQAVISALDSTPLAATINQPDTLKSWGEKLEYGLDCLGDIIMGLLGFGEDDATPAGIGLGEGGGGLAALTENSVYVEVTNSLHPSRPSSFGPHLSEPFRSLLFPITTFSLGDDPRACAVASGTKKPGVNPPEAWIALVERGRCPFSHKVRAAMELGASAVIFGDMAESEGGIPGSGGLLTPWSPDDSSDITIPSSFVSRASYLSLLQTWQSEQKVEEEVHGLLVVMSRDEVFVWPLLDLLLLLLFLPSILTLLTVLTQRLRTLRQQKLDRAPRDAVDRLPVFLWAGEKSAPDSPGTSAIVDEERQIESPPTLSSPTFAPLPEESETEPSETTSLLHPLLTHQRTFLSRLPSVFGVRQSTSTSSSGKDKMGGPLSTRASRAFPGMRNLTECAICLSDFERGDEVMQLPCMHLFHKEEIESWLLGSKRLCPVCRASITPDSGTSTPVNPPASTPTQLTAPVPMLNDSASSDDDQHPVASSSSTTRH